MSERREKGLYWDRAWKLVEGCTKVSPGCDNCWSETETVMRCGHPNKTIRDRARAAVYLGQIPGDKTMFDGRIVMRHDNLDLPLRVKKPTVWACWNDLYHEDVPDEFRDRAYTVMAQCPHHTFLVLTKRSQRLAEYHATVRKHDRLGWPHIWHGVTAENQQTADERIPHLLRVPGKRFVSIEPMLGPIGLYQAGAFHGESSQAGAGYDLSLIHAVLLGGESGPGARMMQMEWVRSVRDQCAAASVPFFYKQGWGLRPVKVPTLDGKQHTALSWP